MAQDLELARRAGAGEADAVSRLHLRLKAAADAAARSLRMEPALAAELGQTLEVRLLIGAPGGKPRIVSYRGQGSLDAFLKASALRVGLDLMKSPDEVTLSHATPPRAADPDVELIQRRYAPVFREALEQVLKSLPADERSLMRMFFVDGFSTEQIGLLRRAHKSTISRWLAQVRERIASECRARLRTQLDVQSSELESLTQLLLSKLDLSLQALAPG